MKLSVNQKKANRSFKEAVAYAKAVLTDPKKSAYYKKMLKPGKSIYHTALADYMRGNAIK